MGRIHTLLSALAFAALSAGCASYSGQGLQPGAATTDEVRKTMGVPTYSWQSSAGEVWAYPRGPAGRYTYFVHFNSMGKLAYIEQVLDEEHFARIKPGEMNREDVRRTLGPPYREIAFPRLKQTAWDYRYRDLWGYTSVFSVMFDASGRVAGTVTTRESPGGRFRGSM